MIRKTLFWLHLACGVVAGAVIALLCVTGVLLAFEPQIVDLASRAERRVEPAGGERLPLSELISRAASQGLTPSAITVSADPTTAALVRAGRRDGAWVDPYTGEVRPLGAERVRAFFDTTTSLHRWLAAEGEGRDRGRAITGAANTVFLGLALSGLVLWIPRRWSRRAVRAVLWFRPGARGRARDFNWHHVVGFWTLPVLVVLTVSGMVISYGWASDLVYTLAGSEAPTTRGRPKPPSVPLDAPPPDGTTPDVDALVSAVAGALPSWTEITVHLDTEPSHAPRLSARTDETWPLFASETFWVDPTTLEILRHDRFSDGDPGRRARAWLRFLHTGEALGWPGQLVAGLASVGGAVLVWTGLALSWRRFTSWRRRRRPAARAA